MYKPDFMIVRTKERSKGPGSGHLVFYPDFIYNDSKDLMVRGGTFYAVWDDEHGKWSTNMNRLCEIIDSYLDWYVREQNQSDARIEYVRTDSTNLKFRLDRYMRLLTGRFEALDQKVTFYGDHKTRNEYVSKELPYRLEAGIPAAYEELMDTLYDPSEQEKLEWAIGAVLTGDVAKIQKFVVLYGDKGTGKSTFLKIVRALFPGYLTTFDAAAIASMRNQFAMEPFKDHPLVAIQDDGDLSRIEDNTRLNQIISHEPVIINEKFKGSYPATINAMLFMGTNRPVEITEARSGITRRLLDVHPTGIRVPINRYNILVPRILSTEIGMIARKCMDVYNRLGPNAYDEYSPDLMIRGTNLMYNFISDNLDKFVRRSEWIQRKDVWAMYKQWCEEMGVKYYKYKDFILEIEAYYNEYEENFDRWIDGERIHKRGVLVGFKKDLFSYEAIVGSEAGFEPVEPPMLVLDKLESRLDSEYASFPAMYFVDNGDGGMRLERSWNNCKTVLKDLDTSKLHGLRCEPNHIVIDFDLTDAMGEKDMGMNLMAAAKWPDTYAEFSRSGRGVHLHYMYAGDPEKLALCVSNHIDIRTMNGKQCFRRAFTKCNDLPIATLSDGMLPKKGDKKKMVDLDGFKNEKVLRSQIIKCLRKEVHPNTRPNIDFIAKLLEEAQASGKFYDVEDLHADVISFAQRSTNQSAYCIKRVTEMKFSSTPGNLAEDSYPLVDKNADGRTVIPNEELTFFDIEIFKNVFMICYKPYNGPVMKMLNPTATEVKELFEMNLVGFNNRSYDNHILWAAGMLNYNIYQLYELSQKIINNDNSAKFPQAYGLSYTDVWDFNSNKQGLKKWEIELGITHIENSYDWDEPLPENAWFEVLDYCANDVIATEAVFNYCHDDYTARCILASLADSVPNQSTRNLVKKVIFGDIKDIRSQLEYTDLSEMFPGYEYEAGISTYKGFEVGEGGFVYATPGIYQDVVTFDVASMHPASLIALNYFGKYTKVYAEMREARIAIKHGDLEKASTLLDGKLAPFLNDENIDPKALANALKLVLNSTYGYTKMTSVLDFVHPKNKDNIIAKRGALFMIDVLKAVQEAGGEVIHIKTDSIKVVNPTNEVTELIYSMGEKYGYEFEVESEYDRIALVNDAVYIAYNGEGWEATGKQFAEPYVYKTLFSGEDVIFDDLCQTKSVKNAKMFIDVSKDNEPSYRFVGTVGRFTPMDPSVVGAGQLMVYRNEKYSAVTGTKGYAWMQSEFVRGNHEDFIDMSYFDELAQKAKDKISEFGNFEKFVKGEL